jgi:hypothetical protein
MQEAKEKRIIRNRPIVLSILFSLLKIYLYGYCLMNMFVFCICSPLSLIAQRKRQKETLAKPKVMAQGEVKSCKEIRYPFEERYII